MGMGPGGHMGPMGPGGHMGPGGPMGPNGPMMQNGPMSSMNGPMGMNGPMCGPNGPMGPGGPRMSLGGPMGPGGMMGHGPMGPGMMGPNQRMMMPQHMHPQHLQQQQQYPMYNQGPIMPQGGGKMMYPPNQPLIYNPQNPNAPPIHPCGACHREVQGDGEDALLCESGCNFWFHRICINMSPDAYFLLRNEPFTEWVCDNCMRTKNIPPIKIRS